MKRHVFLGASAAGFALGANDRLNAGIVGLRGRRRDPIASFVKRPNWGAMCDAWAPALHGVTTIANYQLRPRYRYVPALVNCETLLPAVEAAPMDEGFIAYAPFLRALESGGVAGAGEMSSLIEGGGSMENLERCARKFPDYLREYRALTAAAQPARQGGQR